jgi:hypothetical protein
MTNKSSSTTSTTYNPNPNKVEDTKENLNNLLPFLRDILIALIHVIIIGFLGANFVFLTRVDLDMFFPTDIDDRPYTDKNKVGNKLPPLCGQKLIEQRDSEFGQYGGRKKKQKGGAKGTGCGDFINICESKLFENKYFKGMFDYGFPYTMETKEETFGGIITSWFSNKVKYSYVWLRTVLKIIVEFCSSFCAMVPNDAKDIIPFILGPLCIGILLFVSSIWYLPSLVSVFWNENSNEGMIISIIGLFFGWTWIVPLFTSFVQMFVLMFKIILLPLLINSKELINIMGNKWNAWYMKCLFYIFCILSAFRNFTTPLAIVMTIIFFLNMLPPKGDKKENSN